MTKKPRGKLVSFVDLQVGGLYLFQGLDTHDALALRKKKRVETNMSGYNIDGWIVSGDLFMVIENSTLPGASSFCPGPFCYVDIVHKTGYVWFMFDMAMFERHDIEGRLFLPYTTRSR